MSVVQLDKASATYTDYPISAAGSAIVFAARTISRPGPLHVKPEVTAGVVNLLRAPGSPRLAASAQFIACRRNVETPRRLQWEYR